MINNNNLLYYIICISNLQLYCSTKMNWRENHLEVNIDNIIFFLDSKSIIHIVVNIMAMVIIKKYYSMAMA